MKCGKCKVDMIKSKLDENTTQWICPKCNKTIEEVTYDDI